VPLCPDLRVIMSRQKFGWARLDAPAGESRVPNGFCPDRIAGTRGHGRRLKCDINTGTVIERHDAAGDSARMNSRQARMAHSRPSTRKAGAAVGGVREERGAGFGTSAPAPVILFVISTLNIVPPPDAGEVGAGDLAPLLSAPAGDTTESRSPWRALRTSWHHAIRRRSRPAAVPADDDASRVEAPPTPCFWTKGHELTTGLTLPETVHPRSELPPSRPVRAAPARPPSMSSVGPNGGQPEQVGRRRRRLIVDPRGSRPNKLAALTAASKRANRLLGGPCCSPRVALADRSGCRIIHFLNPGSPGLVDEAERRRHALLTPLRSRPHSRPQSPAAVRRSRLTTNILDHDPDILYPRRRLTAAVMPVTGGSVCRRAMVGGEYGS